MRVRSLSSFASIATLGTEIDIDHITVSPDGRRIVYSAITPDDPRRLLVGRSLDGSARAPMVAGDDPAYSPDGLHIAYAAKVGSPFRHICVINADGSGAPVILHALECDDSAPAWSPDGMHIAFVSNCNVPRSQKTTHNLFVMRRDGAEVEQLSTGEADVARPAWMHNHLYFSANIAGNYDIWRLTVPIPQGPVPSPVAYRAPSAPSAPPPFDGASASAVLRAIASDASSCKRPGRAAIGSATVTFEPTGTASKVAFLGRPLADSRVAACVAAKFRAARIAPFSGAPVTMATPFVVR